MNSITGRTALLLFGSCLIWGFAFGAGSRPPVNSSAPCLTRSELIALKSGRSVVGEVALTLHLSAEGRATDQFLTTLLRQAAEELRSSQDALRNRTNIAALVDEALAGMAVADVARLNEIAANLGSIEAADEQCS